MGFRTISLNELLSVLFYRHKFKKYVQMQNVSLIGTETWKLGKIKGKEREKGNGGREGNN